MESVEASGKSIEDAILQALARLGRNRNEVEISVLQEPSRGTRGMGARDARVRVFIKPGAPARPLPGAPAPEGAEGAGEDAVAEVDALLDEADEYVVEDGYDEETFAEEEVEYAPLDVPIGALKDLLPAYASIEEVAVEALRAILAHMGMPALVEVRA